MKNCFVVAILSSIVMPSMVDAQVYTISPVKICAGGNVDIVVVDVNPEETGWWVNRVFIRDENVTEFGVDDTSLKIEVFCGGYGIPTVVLVKGGEGAVVTSGKGSVRAIDPDTGELHEWK